MQSPPCKEGDRKERSGKACEERGKERAQRRICGERCAGRTQIIGEGKGKKNSGKGERGYLGGREQNGAWVGRKEREKKWRGKEKVGNRWEGKGKGESRKKKWKEKGRARSGLVASNVNEGVKNLNGFLCPDKVNPFFQHCETVVLTIKLSLAKF